MRSSEMRGGSTVAVALAVMLSVFFPVTVQAEPVEDGAEDVEEVLADLPPGEYLVGPGLENAVGVHANDFRVDTQRQWERTIGENDTLSVNLEWEGVAFAHSLVNKFNYTVTFEETVINHREFGGESIHVETFTEPGNYEIIITGTQGVTRYHITITEQ